LLSWKLIIEQQINICCLELENSYSGFQTYQNFSRHKAKP
jgi:hypothetical protein